MTNNEVRRAIRLSGFYFWQVAEKLGMTDSSFSRKLRKELSEDEKQRVYGALKELEKEELNG